MIREGKSAQIYSAIQTGGGMGMQTLEAALAELYKKGLITAEDAFAKSQRPDELRRLAGIADSAAQDIEKEKSYVFKNQK